LKILGSLWFVFVLSFIFFNVLKLIAGEERMRDIKLLRPERVAHLFILLLTLFFIWIDRLIFISNSDKMTAWDIGSITFLTIFINGFSLYLTWNIEKMRDILTIVYMQIIIFIVEFSIVMSAYAWYVWMDRELFMYIKESGTIAGLTVMVLAVLFGAFEIFRLTEWSKEDSKNDTLIRKIKKDKDLL